MLYGICDKCQTLNSELFEFEDGRWLCRANSCFSEEYEKISGQRERDIENLEIYRDWVARTGIASPGEY